MDAKRLIVSPVLVGRDDLLDLADRRLAQVSSGEGSAMLLAGEAGLGKTRLLRAVERRAVAAGFRVHRARTYPSDLRVPAAVLLDLAREMARSTDAADLGTTLEARLASGATGSGDAHRRRRLLVLDVAEVLASIAPTDGHRPPEDPDPRPVLVALEDLHWSDDLTLEIIESLARAVPGRAMLLVATYRSDELYPRVPMRDWRTRLVTQRLAEELRLRRLTLDETATVASALAGSGFPVPRDLASAVHERSDGIPLHIEELLGEMSGVAAADVAPGDRAFRAETVRALDVPETVEAAVNARLERRSQHAATIARAGAVIGRSFDIDLLADVVDEPVDDLSDPLGELVEHFLLVEEPGGGYGFRHALIADAIYARIPAPRRRRWHDRTATAAARRPDIGTDAFLALHYERAGRHPEAYAAAVTAARSAEAISSHAEASDLYAIALRTCPPTAGPIERAALLEAYGTQAAATDHNALAAELFEAARSAYLEGGDRLAAAAVVGPLVAVRHLLGEGLEDRAIRLHAALDDLPGKDDKPGRLGAEVDRVRARLLAELAAAFMLDRRLDQAMVHAADAIRVASAVDARPIERHAAATLGSCEVFSGLEPGWARLERVLSGSVSGHLESEASRAYRMIGSCASMLVEYERAEVTLREGLAYAESVELWNHRHYMAAHLAHVLWATGRWDEAEAVARQVLADGRGGITTRITALHVLGYIGLGRGSSAQARASLEEARDLGEQMHELQRLSPALWGLAELALIENDARTAVGLVEAGLAASAEVDDAAHLFPFAVTGVRAYHASGDPDGARRWADRIVPRLEARAIPGTLPAIDHARGLVLLRDGRTLQARRALGRAADAWTARGRVWEGIWARIDLARAYQRANLLGPAAAEIAAAREAAQRLESPILERAIDMVVDAAGTPSDSAVTGWDPLTDREFAVARLIAEGLTNADIGLRLGISPRTVGTHVEHILSKLEMRRRTEIASWIAARPVLHSRPHGDDREE